jgi:hypothetical protein
MQQKLKKLWGGASLSVFSLNCLVLSIVFGGMVNFGFLTETWFEPVFGKGVVDYIAAVVSGIILGLGAYGLYLDSETAIRSIFKKTNHWEIALRTTGLVILNVAFVGIGILGLWFRLGFLNSRGVGFLGVAGIILECCPPIIGLVIQPLMNPDLDVLEETRMSRLARTTMDEVYDGVESLSPSDRFGAIYGENTMEDLLDNAANSLKPEPKKQKTGRITPLTSRLNKKRIPLKKGNIEEEDTEEDFNLALS